MGLRFRKSIKIAPGIKLNISTKGVGVSAGVKGAHVSINSRGRKTTTVGIPGTGLSWSSSYTSHQKPASTNNKSSAADKEKQKQLEMKEARAAVEEYEALIKKITSIHKYCGSPLDWPQLLSLPAPFDEAGSGPLTHKAQQDIDSYEPGFWARNFGIFEKAKRSLLNSALEQAQKKDAEDYTKWSSAHEMAERMLSKDTDLMLDITEGLAPLEGLLEYGTSKISFVDPDTAKVDFCLADDKLIPEQNLSLTPTGKLSSRAMSAKKHKDLIHTILCSCMLRIAHEMFLVTPVKRVLINTGDISADICRADLSTLDFETLDPVDIMKGFIRK